MTTHKMTMQCIATHKCGNCKHEEANTSLRCIKCIQSWRAFDNTDDGICGWESINENSGNESGVFCNTEVPTG